MDPGADTDRAWDRETERRLRLESDHEADTEPRGSRRWLHAAGCVTALVGVGLGLGITGIVALRAFDKPPRLLSLMQLQQVTLLGTWKDKAGATIVFTSGDPSLTFRNGIGGGELLFTFDGGGWAPGAEPVVSLLVEGGPIGPVLVRRYPDNNDECTFRRQ